MPSPSINRVVHFLRRAVSPTGGEEDGELLRRFVAAREEAAFAGLVRRHAAMVLGVCRRVLDDAHDAEDAFQATFLVLARRAAAVRKRDSLASWLYGVAYRVSLKARAAASRRPQTGDQPAEPASAADPVAEAAWRELRPAIDEELSRLPEKYRAPLVLCYLEGRTNEEAARLLGWTKGTVSGRLARARDLLRPRLARRGLALAAGGVAVLLAQHAAAPASTALVETTVNAVLAGNLSGHAAAIAGGVIRAMFLKKITTLAALVVGVGLVGGGVGLLKQYAPGGEDQPGKGKPGVVFTLPEEPKKEKEPDDLLKLQGIWQAVALEHNGEKLSAEAVKKFRVVIRDNTITFDPDGNKREASFALSTSNKPKAIVLKTDAKGPTVPGIYAVTDKELKICFDNDEGKAAPAEFTTRPDSGLTLITLERGSAAGAPEEKRYTLAMDKKPWKEVIEWFADVSGLRYTGKETPPGTFTFNPPKDKQYTIPEIVDILNDALLADKKAPYLLIRRPRQPPGGTFALVPADQKVPPPIPLVSLEDLDKFGRTEIVWVVVPLKGGRSAEVIAAVRKLQSPWGSATTTGGGRRLTLTDTTASVREIIKALKESDVLDEPAPDSLRRFKGADSPVRAVAFSPDGKTLWTCREDGRVSSWDVATGKVRASLKADGNKCLAMTVSPDGKRVLLGGTVVPEKGKGADENMELAGWVAVYSAALDKLIWHHVDFSGPIRAVAFSPDGKRVAAANNVGSVLLMDAETDKVIMTPGHPQNGRLTAVAFSPDGKLLVAGGADGLVKMWDVATGKEVRALAADKGEITSLAFSPDGRLLLTAGRDQPVRLWDVTTGKEERGLGGVRVRIAAAFSPDGKRVAWGTDNGAVRLYDMATAKVVESFQAVKGVNGLAFSPDGKTLAAGGADGAVKLWDVGK